MLKNKRVLWITLGVLFIVVLFFIKRTTTYTNEAKNDGIVYGTEQIGTLVNRDSDQDGLLDWEEGLWGTDPSKKDTDDDGILDSTEIERREEGTLQSSAEISPEEPEVLTQTDVFSRELFSTVAALTQNGAITGETAEELGGALSSKLESVQRKVYVRSQMKVVADNSKQAMQNYNAATGKILINKYPLNEKIVNVISASFIENEEIDAETLSQLNPIISQLEVIINGLVSTPVPSDIADAHVDFINAFEGLRENLIDMQTVEDPVVAISAITNYQKNIDKIQFNLEKIAFIINTKMKM